MKCPKCGYIILPGIEHCEKCGHHFTRVIDQAPGIPPLFQQTPAETKGPAVPDSESGKDRFIINGPEQHSAPLEMEFKREAASSSSSDTEEEEPGPHKPQDFQAWQSELAERVQEYRQRRDRLGNNGKTDDNTLNFDFDPPGPDPTATRHNVIEFPPAEEPESHPEIVPEPPSDLHPPVLEELDLAPERENKRVTSTARGWRKSPRETGPLEIELEPSQAASSTEIGSGDNSAISVAPVSVRFVAGAIDALILLLGAGVFGLIFWQTGGHLSLQPLGLAVDCVIGVFFILLYFAGCTALASATPGLVWSGLEVRTFEGNSPGLAECFWRGFGYLVSGSALMLGFIWSAVDAEGLTWHDRMSRTFVTPASRS